MHLAAVLVCLLAVSSVDASQGQLSAVQVCVLIARSRMFACFGGKVGLVD